MRKFRHIFLLFAGLLASMCLKAEDGGTILWWLIEDSSNPPPVDWYGTPATMADIGADSARLRVDDAGGTVAYLDFYMLDPISGDYELWSGPEGGSIPVWAFTDIAGYTSPEYKFSVELGQWESGDWVKSLAFSEPVSYATIAEHVGTWEEMLGPDATPWSPSSYTVPEPSAGLLMMLGAAALVLRRKQRRTSQRP